MMKRIVVSVSGQQLLVFDGDRLLARFEVSTSAKGMGCEIGSLRTPTGRFRISEKIGDGEAVGTIFKARVACGVWHEDDKSEDDLILTRILRLEGMDSWNLNTMDRFIYIHGTNHESSIGHPVSHGCIRMANRDVIGLYDMVESGDRVEIYPENEEGWAGYMW
jgi:UDP-N-acetylmuramate--alanine ligase